MCSVPEYPSLAELDHPGDGLVLTLHCLNPHLLLDLDQLGPALLLLFPPQTCVHQLRPHAHSKASLEPAPLAVCSRYAVHLTGHVPTDTSVAPGNASPKEGPERRGPFNILEVKSKMESMITCRSSSRPPRSADGPPPCHHTRGTRR